MTREEIKNALPILQAFAEGKTIQWSDADADNIWHDMSELEAYQIINYPDSYRIKPEHKYRPFKNANECWNEMLKHQPFGWVKANPGLEYCTKYYPNKEKVPDLYYHIRKVAPSYVKYDDIDDYCEITEYDKPYEKVFKMITFADGTPFGIKEMED